MLKRALAAGATAFVAAACADTTTAPTDPIQAARVATIALCHWDATTGQYGLINAPASGKAYQKHLAHGDGEPGGAVPGMPGYVFDASCVTVAAERVFAIAYTDVDPDDGPGFKDGTDVLISKLVDANNDGVISVGDRVVMGSYPTNFDATQFGGFAVTTHTVDGLVLIVPPSIAWVHVSGGNVYFVGGSPTEYFGETTACVFDPDNWGCSQGSWWLRDDIDPGVYDSIYLIEGGGPSQFDTQVSLFRVPNELNDGFLDVEVDLNGL